MGNPEKPFLKFAIIRKTEMISKRCCMKKIITAFCLFMSLLTGSAFADTLKLPGGEVLDFSDKVDVWTMEESFFSRPGNSLAGKEKNIVKSGTDLIPGSSSLVTVPQNITDKMKVYQLRSYTSEAFHQAVAVSASLSGTDREVMEKLLARNHPKQEKMKIPGEEKNEVLRNFLKSKEWVAAEPLQSRLASKGIKIYITGKEGWKDKISKTGRPYRIGFAKAAIDCNGFVLPVFAGGLIYPGEKETVYTLFISDQPSGAYFAPYIKKAAEGKK